MPESAVARIALVCVAAIASSACVGGATHRSKRNAYVANGVILAGGAGLVALGTAGEGSDATGDQGWPEFYDRAAVTVGVALVAAGIAGVLVTAALGAPESAAAPRATAAAAPIDCASWKTAIALTTASIERAALERDRPRACAHESAR
jgi:hypothetical protein